MLSRKPRESQQRIRSVRSNHSHAVPCAYHICVARGTRSCINNYRALPLPRLKVRPAARNTHHGPLSPSPPARAGAPARLRADPAAHCAAQRDVAVSELSPASAPAAVRCTRPRRRRRPYCSAQATSHKPALWGLHTRRARCLECAARCARELGTLCLLLCSWASCSSDLWDFLARLRAAWPCIETTAGRSPMP